MAKNLTDDQQFRLEMDFVDKYGLTGVLVALEWICAAKADHVASSYQDEALAKVWEAALASLERCEKSKAIQALKGVGF
jgi:hypothetical protein